MSLPTEDVEISESNMSVKWMLDIKQDTERSARTMTEAKDSIHPSEKSIETSSDLNTRDEIADLQSCPEEIGKSTSMSNNDLGVDVDFLTDELFGLLVQ